MQFLNGYGKNRGGCDHISAVGKLLQDRVKYILVDLSHEAFSAVASAYAPSVILQHS